MNEPLDQRLQELAMEVATDRQEPFLDILKDLVYIKHHTPDELTEMYRQSKGICYDGVEE